MTDWQGVLAREIYREFENAAVVILGGGNGIGAAIVDAFHWLGARLAVVDRDEKAAIARVRELERRVGTFGQPVFSGRAFAADLKVEREREHALDAVVAALGSPRVVISTVGCDARIKFDAVAQDDLERLVTINGIAPVLAARQLMPSMRDGGGGAICLVTSRHATEILEPDALGYAGGKAFLEIGMRNLARSAGSVNTPENIIRVFGFCPGWVRTESQERRYSRHAFDDAVNNQLVPLETYAEDLVPSVIHLCSKHACRFSGRIYHEDGGEGNLRGGRPAIAKLCDMKKRGLYDPARVWRRL